MNCFEILYTNKIEKKEKKVAPAFVIRRVMPWKTILALCCVKLLEPKVFFVIKVFNKCQKFLNSLFDYLEMQFFDSRTFITQPLVISLLLNNF